MAMPINFIAFPISAGRKKIATTNIAATIAAMETVLRLPLTASAAGTHKPTIEVSQSG